MANSRPPKNDFAPSWLRLPEPSSNSTTTSLKVLGPSKEKKSGFNGQFDFNGFSHQRNFFDFPENEYGPFGGYPSEKYSRSQAGVYKDAKYAPTHVGQVDYKVNGHAFDYNDHNNYDYHDHPSYYSSDINHSQPWTGQGAKKPRPIEKDSSRVNGKRRESRSKSTSDEKANNDVVGTRAEEEFPSLIGEADNLEQQSSGKAVSGAWEKPPRGIIRMPPSPMQPSQLQNSTPASPAGGWTHLDGSSKKDASPSQMPNTNIYKALVPNKAILARKSSRDSIKTTPVKDVSNSQPSVKSPPTAVHRINNIESTSPHQSITNGTAVTPPTPIIFTTRIVSQPKKLGDKKSHFLKQLKMGSDENGVGESDTMKTDKKQEDSNSMDGEENGEKDLTAQTNGMELLKIEEPDEMTLSSSLEAEHRLLREMGWDEGATEVCEITEEERREFEKQLQLRQKIGTKTPRARKLQQLTNGYHGDDLILNSTDEDDSESDVDN